MKLQFPSSTRTLKASVLLGLTKGSRAESRLFLIVIPSDEVFDVSGEKGSPQVSNSFIIESHSSKSRVEVLDCDTSVSEGETGAQLPLVSQRFFLRYVDASGVSGGVTGRGALLECAVGEVVGATTCAGEVGRKGA